MDRMPLTTTPPDLPATTVEELMARVAELERTRQVLPGAFADGSVRSVTRLVDMGRDHASAARA